MASMRYGTKRRFTMNPGVSCGRKEKTVSDFMKLDFLFSTEHSLPWMPLPALLPFTFSKRAAKFLTLSRTATSPLLPCTSLSEITPFLHTPPKVAAVPGFLEPGSAQWVSELTRLHTAQTDQHGNRVQMPFHFSTPTARPGLSPQGGVAQQF